MNHAVLTFVAMLFFIPSAWAKVDTSALKSIPMQEAGRLKPYDTFARESLLLIYGKSSYKKRPAHEIILTWFIMPEEWSEKPIVQVKHAQLKETLKLPKEETYFKPNDLFGNDRLALAFQELAGKQQTREKLDPYFQSVQRLQNQLGVFRAITSGEIFRFVPVPGEDAWMSIHNPAFPDDVAGEFQKMMRAFVDLIGAEMQPGTPAGEVAQLEENLAQAVAGFKTVAAGKAPEKYPTAREMGVEIHYNGFDPFKWSWISYLLGVLLLSFAWYTGGRKIYILSWAIVVLGFLLHTYGFGLRVYIAGRPPVSNMYETVIWVSWGGMLFGMIIEAVYRQRFILLCGGIGAVFCLVLASLAPTILDASISPLEPVLVSNFWLLIHVLTITISYSAFLLAFVLGDVGLAFAISDEQKNRDKIRNISNAIYRAIQIGVVLLAAGTILGGIWADYSWGRFWGWDPKETWALIALLGYLAVLHGRLAGWLGPFGMLIGAIASFSLVIMAWYGVNFVLGAGLHSYGFGGGGIQYVSGFVGAHFVYIAYGLVARQRSGRRLDGASTR